jgi:hypothetical protein
MLYKHCNMGGTNILETDHGLMQRRVRCNASSNEIYDQGIYDQVRYKIRKFARLFNWMSAGDTTIQGTASREM